MFYIYILQSQKDSSFYIGFTENLNQRLEKHNSSTSGYTSTKKPWIIVYSESFENKTDALKREIFIKNQKSRDFIKKLIEDSSARIPVRSSREGRGFESRLGVPDWASPTKRPRPDRQNFQRHSF